MTQFAIDSGTAQAILDYLITQPYEEVHRLVLALQSIQPVEDPSELVAAPEPSADEASGGDKAAK